VRSVRPAGSVIASLASLYASSHEVIERLLRMPRITGAALELLASARRAVP